MVEQKKGPKQASISAFFSPKKPGEETEEAKELEAKSSATKRPRASSPAAKLEATTGDKIEAEKAEEKPPAKKKVATAKTKAKTKAKAKGKTKASPKPKPKKRQPRRFISPHADDGPGDEDDEDLEDEGDVFNTPEAKRARAELESGGEIVPAGAPISGDAVVSDAEIVDVSDEDAKSAERVTSGDKEETAEDDAVTVDLTADEGAVKSVVQSEDAKKGKATKAKAKPTAKTPTKRQQKMKEKAVAAEAKPAPVEPLDPVIQARVDTYKLKMEELTRLFTELLQSKQESDVLMQDIYGAGLDCDLDVTVEHEKARQTLSETWQKLREHAQSTSNAGETVALPSTIEFPHEVKSLIVKCIQGRTCSLSVLTTELLASFKKEIESDDVDMETGSNTKKTISFDTESVNSAAVLTMEMEIKMLAQRTPHGVRPAKANLFEDTSADALWIWEVGNLEKYFGDEAQKTVKRMRKHRKRLGQQLKTLARVVQLLHQKPVDEAKVSAEEAKVGKFGFVVDAEVQKAKDREAKEQEKRQAAEEKKRHEVERQQAKDEEKRKRELKEEEKEIKSSKRQKIFKSFFVQSKDNAGAETAGSNGAGTSDSAIDITGDEDMEMTGAAGETRSAKMVRMDAAISFLGSSNDASSSPDTSRQSIFSSLKNKRDATKKLTDNLPPQAWSARRHKDPKLGIMKLLQFYENVRPAYYGTFSTQSRLFHGGRRPLAQFSKFDYSVDSDDEWEEEEPGESLSDADSDGEESDEDNLDYGDQWLAYEDEVDYMDDAAAEDGPMESAEGPSSPTKHKLPSQLQKKRVKAKAVKPAKLEPQIVGPFWCTQSGVDACTESHFSGLAAELLVEPVFESTLMRKAREYEEEQKRLESERQEQQRKKEQQQALEKQKAAAAAAAPAVAGALAPPVEKKATSQKAAPQKAAPKKAAPKKAAPKKATPQKATPQKATPQKATPQKTKSQKATPQKTSAKQDAASPSTGSVQSASAASSATPSPAKAAHPLLDAWLKKKDETAATSSPKSQQQQEKPKEGDSVEVISVD
ncbi:Chromatin assembly factor 1, subunit A, variant 2 [Phytophthora ramorum]|nr:Chromatin assembly factor 1 subunit A-B [Phytophthora ramorum]